MRLRHSLLAAGVLGALAAPVPALAAWTAPVTVDASDQANPVAEAAFGGSVLTGWLEPTFSMSKRTGDTFGAPAPLGVADRYEKAWSARLDADGNAIVLTVRKHKPVQRIRATFVSADGARSGPMTISDHAHSAAQPTLDVAPDGTAVAAWDWHDKAGWRAQAAVRLPGQARFGKPQTISPPAAASGRPQPRPWIHVAAGNGGRAVLTWQIGGDYRLPESPLHVVTAGADGVFGADQALADAGGLADVALAVDPAGAVQVAYLDGHFSGNEGPSKLHVSQGQAGAPLSDPAVLSTGGKGTSSGEQIAAAFTGDGTAVVAWAKPGDSYEDGGELETFTRPSGGAFGAAQQIAPAAQGVALAAGPGGSATLAWMHYTSGGHPAYAVHTAIRPQTGGGFGPEQTVSAADRNALWPSVAMTPQGDAIATWVTNTDGGGGGQVAAAVGHP